MYPEVIKSESKPVLQGLNNFPGFYLAGGTALALQIGHRISVDFDLFTSEELPQDLLKQIENIFGDSAVQPIVNQVDQITVTVDNIQVTFLHYPFPPLLDLVKSESVQLLSVKEIAATKAYTLGRRATFKDYVDLYFIFKEDHANLKDTIELAEQKYGERFNRKLFLEQLVYLEDIKTVDIEFLKEPVSKDQMRDFFDQQIQNSDLL